LSWLRDRECAAAALSRLAYRRRSTQQPRQLAQVTPMRSRLVRGEPVGIDRRGRLVVKMENSRAPNDSCSIEANPHRVQLQTHLVAGSSVGGDDVSDPHTAWPPPGPGAVPLPFGADRSRGCRAGYATPLSAGLRLPYRSRTGRANASLWLWHLCHHQR
jgi:hypothetical protein